MSSRQTRSARTLRRCAVLGSPIGHSRSPALHGAAYAALGLAQTWRYDAIDVTKAQLPGFVASLDECWRGLSLTMPLKEVALDLLDVVSTRAELLASVNTVLIDWVEGVARLRGENTDTYGMVAAVREVVSPASGRRGCVLGAGATARSALAALVELGCQEVTVVARRPAAARGLAGVSDRLGLRTQVVPWSQAWPAMAGSEIAMSTVPAGATHELATRAPGLLPGGHLPTGTVLLDVVYEPWPTPLAEAWETAGGTVVSGASMLLHQAAAQVELMTRRPAPIQAMRAAL